MKSKFDMVKLAPVYKDYIWGGNKLNESFGKESGLERTAESWEFCIHKDGENRVIGGEFDGLKLSEYIEKCGRELLGANALEFDRFPVLIKFIDAADNLSVQVHPSDEYALVNENEYGKTEVWYILECDEGACLHIGLNRDVTREELEERIHNNTLTDIINKVPVKRGEVYFIEAGTVHAIGRGTVICEIQQNSNTTYRVYDYGRRDKNGNTRELHIDKALDVIDRRKSVPENSGNGAVIAKCKYFTAEKVNCDGTAEIVLNNDSFRSLIIADGEGELALGEQKMRVTKGDSIFIPAQSGEVTVSGKCEIVVTRV